MHEKEKKDMKDRAKNSASGFTPENGRRMFEMMRKCCAGGFPDCSSMMKRHGKARTPRAKNRGN